MECHLITYLLSRNRHFFHFSSLFAQSVISITRIVIARTSDTSHDHLSTKFTTVLAYGSMAAFNLVPRVSRARRDPGRVWSRASVTIENTREGSSLNKEFVSSSFLEFKAKLIASRCDSAITRDVLQ